MFRRATPVGIEEADELHTSGGATDMTSIRWWGPNADVLTAARAMDRLFDQFLGPGQNSSQEGGTATYTLPVDILETDDSYVLYASVPGVAGENVDVTFEEGMLTITAKAQPFETQGRWIRQERPWGNWTRRLELPKEIDGSGISAEFENGVLVVTVPKAARAQPVRIPVAANKPERKPVK
jgi:HSP20 family protein